MANYTMNTMSDDISKLTMNLFGLPYQFPDAVDPRVKNLSPTIGKNFTQKILHEAPVLTIIPGKPAYLTSKKSHAAKTNTTVALINAAKGDISQLSAMKDANDVENMRLYDFESDYSEYMKYVNILCRAGASFLGLRDTITIGNNQYPFQSFDWRQYRFNINAQKGMIKQVGEGVKALKNNKPTPPSTKGLSKKKKEAKLKKYEKELKEWNKKNKEVKKNQKALEKKLGSDAKFVMEFDTSTTGADEEGTLTRVFENFNYVQFYVDPESGQTDSMTNQTGASSLASTFEGYDEKAKDLMFLANSGGFDVENLTGMVDGASSEMISGVGSIIDSANGVAGTIYERITGVASRVIKGENIIFPDVYKSSSYGKQYSVTVHLRSPYGSIFGYYMNIYVPLMHLLALALPKQASANSYAAPFLVKGYLEGMWTVNMGIVTDITITKDTETLSANGLPMSVDVTLTIQDLYADLSMSPSDKPLLFINNSSLIEYLATTCGMSLTKPNAKVKFDLIVKSVLKSLKDIPSDIFSKAEENIQFWLYQNLGL